MSDNVAEHIHYYYTFGEVVSRRVTKVVVEETLSCQSSPKMSLIGAGKNHCSFVAKQEVSYAASKVGTYHVPKVTKAGELAKKELEKGANILDTRQLEKLFGFNVQLQVDVNDEGTKEPSSKRLCVRLTGEVSKNELASSALKELLLNQGLVVDTGLLDDAPPTYSPFHRSAADLFMYHKEFYKKGVVISATCVADQSEGSAEASCIVTSGVWEMKNRHNAFKQLHANMVHFAAQLVVQAVKQGDIVDCALVYGLSVRYEMHSATLFIMKMDLVGPSTTVEDFGQFSLSEAINIVVRKLV